MYSQRISKHFKFDADIWYCNQEMKMISISMAVIILFGLVCAIGYIVQFNLCFDNNFYYIGDYIICIKWSNVVFLIIPVIISIYKNVKTRLH